MENTFWHKQTLDQPLFPDLLWSQPEHKATAGKLLIIGGHSGGFAVPAEAYNEAVKAGIGIAKVLLPEAAKKLVGPVMENGDFAPSTPSGSFSRQAMGELLDYSAWADGILLAGELGHNSETAILLEQFVSQYGGQLTITRDVIDYFKNMPQLILNRRQTNLILSLAQLQKLAIVAKFPLAFKLGMDLMKLVEALHAFTQQYSAAIIVKHHQQLVAGLAGQVSTTKLKKDMPIWRVKTAAHVAVWYLQTPTKPFEALTTAAYNLI